jgi:hypothetical protein
MDRSMAGPLYRCKECGAQLPNNHLLGIHVAEAHDFFFAAQVARRLKVDSRPNFLLVTLAFFSFLSQPQPLQLPPFQCLRNRSLCNCDQCCVSFLVALLLSGARPSLGSSSSPHRLLTVASLNTELTL